MAVNRDDGYLDQAVASVLAQTFQDFEFVIVANNCTDILWSQLQKFTTDPRVRLFRTQLGQLPFNLNYGVDVARGKYIARMDADDICAPTRFAEQIQFFKDHPEVHVLGSAYREINGQGVKGPLFIAPLTDEEIRNELPWTCCLAHPTLMFLRETFLDHRGYAYSLYGEDYDLWLRMRRSGKVVFANLPTPLLDYRLHEAQSSSGSKRRANFPYLGALLYREWMMTGEWIFIGALIKRWLGGFFRGS